MKIMTRTILFYFDFECWQDVLQLISIKAQIPLGSSGHVRHDTTRSTCPAGRDERVEPCCSTSSTQPNAWAGHIERVVSCRDVTSQENLGFIGRV